MVRLERGKKVTSDMKNVPAIAVTLGTIPLAFSIGSSLMRNRIDINPRKQMMDDLETTSARNLRNSVLFPAAGWSLRNTERSAIFRSTT
jgi:hypothetical protein